MRSETDDAGELLDDAPATTATPRRPSRWCLDAAEAGVEFAAAILKFPIEGEPLRPVSLPGYPVEELYHRGFQLARGLVEAMDDCDDDTDFGASDDDWLAIDWSRRLCDHLVGRFGWAPWLAFEEFSWWTAASRSRPPRPSTPTGRPSSRPTGPTPADAGTRPGCPTDAGGLR